MPRTPMISDAGDPRAEDYAAQQQYGFSALPPVENGGLQETLAKLWRRKLLIIGVALAALVLTAAITMSMTPRYVAEAKLRVGMPEGNLTDISSGSLNPGADAALVQSEQYILTSREVAGRVVDRLGLKEVKEFNPRLQEPSFLAEYNPKRLLSRFIKTQAEASPANSSAGSSDEPPVDRERELTINSLLNSISVEPLGRSHVIAIGVKAEDPVLSAKIANTLGDVYMEEKAIQRADAVGNANSWLNKHIEQLRGELQKSERAVEDYRRKHSLYSSRSDSISAQQLGELNTQVISAQAELAEAQSRLQQAIRTSKSGSGTMTEVLHSPLIQALKQQQSTVERRAAELSTKYGKKHPTIQDIEAEKADITRKINTEINNIIAGLRSEAAASRARYQTLKSNLEESKKSMGETNAESIELNALEREAEANRELFQQFLQRVKETNVQRDMALVNARLISRAAVPGSPASPPVDLLLIVGLLGGILAGVLLVLMIEQLDDTFRTDDEIEMQTSLPTLSVVPRVSRRKLKDDYILRNPTSQLSESIRKLAMSLRVDEGHERGKVVMMTSSVANEGKSGICLSLAKQTAATGANVIILDCDWRRPQLHSMVGRSNRIGIGELLTGNTRPEDVVYRDSSGAHMIFAGKLRARHANLIFSDRMRYLLQSLSKHYDLVLIDTPPVLVGAEVMHLSRLVDKAIYIVRWGRTRRDVALKGLRHMAGMDAPLIGTVLSQVHTRRYRRYVRHGDTYGYGPAALGRAG